MKRTLITQALLIALLTGTVGVFAQDDIQEPEGQKAIKVCSFGSFKAYQEFQQNVDLMKRQRERLRQLQALLQNCAKVQREGIEQELQDVLAKLNENNKKMFETYGYRVQRNYTLITNQADLYMFVTPEEFAKWEAEQKKADEKSEEKKPEKKGK